jgi:hypothetical protein
MHRLSGGHIVRTTLNIDDDVLDAARTIAWQRGVAVGRAISELARQALSHQSAAPTRNGVPLFPVQPGAGIVTSETVRAFLDEAP